jgi:hypothetical protein
MVRHHSLNDIV